MYSKIIFWVIPALACVNLAGLIFQVLNVTGTSDPVASEEGGDDDDYNLGVILFRTGKKEKSFSYLSRSVKLAEGTGYESMIRRLISHYEIQL